MDQILKAGGGEAAIGHIMPELYRNAGEQSRLTLLSPEEGSNVFIDCMCIPRS